PRRHRRRRHPGRLRAARTRLPRARARGRLDPPSACPGPARSRARRRRGVLTVHLYELPLLFALIGLSFYTVLAGADFGAGWWQLTAGKGPDAVSIRDHAHQAMGPVWEANHVWLIFVLTVVWTAYPSAFGSIASTLSIPLFIAAVGIIFRGTAYALRAGAQPLYHRLVEGRGLIGLIASIVAGCATLGLVWWKRYEASRYTAALAVAAIIAGWALAQSPVFLEGLTVREAAAGRDTLVAVTVAVLAGAAILFPS